MILLNIDFLGLDQKELEWYQMGIRTVIVFIIALIFIRISGMRTFGTQSAFDVVVSLMLGGILSRGITGHYPFFSVLAAAALLALLHRLVAYLSMKSKMINSLTEGKAVQLYKDGRRIHQALSRHCITEQALIAALHEENLEDFKKVKVIWLEPDGKISIVKTEEQ